MGFRDSTLIITLNYCFSMRQKSIPRWARDNFLRGATMQLKHSVWKSQKKSHSTLRAKRATFTFWVAKSSLKMPKIVHFGNFLKTWSLKLVDLVNKFESFFVYEWVSLDVASCLNFYKTELNAKDDVGRTVFMRACQIGRNNVVKLVIYYR